MDVMVFIMQVMRVFFLLWINGQELLLVYKENWGTMISDLQVTYTPVTRVVTSIWISLDVMMP
ncbi:hypothetical protein D3C80_2013070 [compost metagenome]